MLLGQRGTTVTATITLSVAEVCDQSAVLVSSGSIDEACKGACIAQEEHCYGRQPSDSYYDAPATTPDMCSDACLNAMDAHETAFQNCGGYAPVGSAQRHRFDCAGIPDSATVEEACDQSAVLVGSSSTSATCTNACVAKEEHCYGLQPSDLYWEPSSSPTPPDQCSDACFNAMDAHELACENCVGSRAKTDACIAKQEHCYGLQPTETHYGASPTVPDMCSDACLNATEVHELACENCVGSVYPGTAQGERDWCASWSTASWTMTVGHYCTLEASHPHGDGTSCEDACKAYYQTCYEADEAADWYDVVVDHVHPFQIWNENYCL
eukprot:g18429.t1